MVQSSSELEKEAVVNIKAKSLIWGKLTLITKSPLLVTKKEVFLTGIDFKIGRALNNDLVIPDMRLSSLHSRIVLECDDNGNKCVKLWDHSSNGTFHQRYEVSHSDQHNYL